MKAVAKFFSKVMLGVVMLTLFATVSPHGPLGFSAFGAELPDLPQPGELLADVIARDAPARRDMTIVNYTGVIRIAFSSVPRFAELDRFEVIIHGNNIELDGTGVVVYNTGQRSHDAVHEVFADGERVTVFIDHSLGTQGEMFIPFRSVVGTQDTVMYAIPVRTNEVPATPRGSYLFLAEASVGSPNQSARVVATGSVFSVFVPPVAGSASDFGVQLDTSAAAGLRTTRATIPAANQTPPVSQAEQPPTRPEPNPTPTPGVTTPLPTPTPQPQVNFNDVPQNHWAVGLNDTYNDEGAISLPILYPTPTVVPNPIMQSIITLTIGQTTYAINGVTHHADAAPFISDGRTMVPLRVVAEALGAEVDWIGETRTATIVGNGVSLALPLDAPLPNNMGTPVSVGGRTFVPLAYVAEMLGATVGWDGATQTVTITSTTA